MEQVHARGGELDNYVEGSVSHIDELERMYRPVARQRRKTLAGPRLHDLAIIPSSPRDASPEQLEWYAKRTRRSGFTASPGMTLWQ